MSNGSRSECLRKEATLWGRHLLALCMPHTMMRFPLLGTSNHRILVLAPSFAEVMENKAILQVCRTTKISHCECCLGKIMLEKECTSSHGRRDLSVQARTQHRQRVGLRMCLNVHVLILSIKKSRGLKFTWQAKSMPMMSSTAYLLRRGGFVYPSITGRLLVSIYNLSRQQKRSRVPLFTILHYRCFHLC